ncbi:MAG: Gfo/Idh/MocA family oxidoreductase [Candidatus Dormibacteraeota bacterium]|nr:Gfo/Idh/MocA family oxidoreductase [Candidatus Dormibacteraeota bacterium]
MVPGGGSVMGAAEAPVGTIQLVQAGLGRWGRNWAREVLPEVGEVRPVGWADPSPTSLSLGQQDSGLPPERCFPTLEKAIAAADGAVDAALVTTDLPHHAETVRAALEAGLHVLVEKPFATSVAEGRELVELAERRGRILMVSQNYRFHGVVRQVAELVRGAELGQVDEVAIDFRRLSEHAEDGPRRHHLEEQPLLVDMSIHHFDLLRLVLGSEARRVDCRTWNPGWSGFSGPPAGAALIEFANGVVVSYRGSWVSRGEITPWSGEWRMQCRGGEIQWAGRGDRGARLERLHIRRREGGAGAAFKEEDVTLAPLGYQDRAGALHEFAQAILQGRAPETSGRDNLGTLALMDAAVTSAAQGAPVDLP